MFCVCCSVPLLPNHFQENVCRARRSQLEVALENTQRNLSRKSNELTAAEDRIRTLEVRNAELNPLYN